MESEEGRDLLRKIRQRSDESDEERAVNRYAGAILMPRDLVTEAAVRIERTRWSDLYELAERFGVTISALTVRLQQLNLLWIKEGQPYESREAATGQQKLVF